MINKYEYINNIQKKDIKKYIITFFCFYLI